jgi:hypothetical protein
MINHILRRPASKGWAIQLSASRVVLLFDSQGRGAFGQSALEIRVVSRELVYCAASCILTKCPRTTRHVQPQSEAVLYLATN